MHLKNKLLFTNLNRILKFVGCCCKMKLETEMTVLQFMVLRLEEAPKIVLHSWMGQVSND